MAHLLRFFGAQTDTVVRCALARLRHTAEVMSRTTIDLTDENDDTSVTIIDNSHAEVG